MRGQENITDTRVQTGKHYIDRHENRKTLHRQVCAQENITEPVVRTVKYYTDRFEGKNTIYRQI